MPESDITIHDVHDSAIAFAQVGGNLTGDVIAGNKTIITNIIQQAAKQIVTAPYKFLASYDISDRDIFFGRNAVIEQLVGNFPRFKTLVINGRSGSGKTSLINAGLIPRLAENGYHYISFREYSDPLRQLQEHVRQDEVFRPFADATHSLRQFLITVTRQQHMPLVVIFDQFERFFVEVPAALRAQFIQEIKACLLSDLSGQELDLVFALREDFFGAFIIEFEAVIPTFFHETDRFNLLPLGMDEAREAILNPLRRVAYKIGYDKTFVDDVLLPGLMGESAAGSAIDPPHLQIVCNQLYQAACERHAAELAQGDLVQIDRALYTQLGETSGILRTYLDDFIDRAAHRDAGGRDVLRSMLKLMLETTGTRKFVSFADLKAGLPDVPPTAIEQHIREFQDGRIIETRKSADIIQYSLSHEVMVEKVQSWFDERELERKKAQETLERGLAEWKNTQALLNEKQVSKIRQWLSRETLSDEADEFLTKSQDAYERATQEKAERERQLREQEDARRKAEKEYAKEQRRRAEEAEKHAAEQSRSAKRLRWLVRGVAMLLVVAVGIAWFARNQQREAEQQARVALARQLAAQAMTVLEEYPQRSALLAIEAVKLTLREGKPLVPESEEALREVLSKFGGTGISAHKARIAAMALSQDGHWLVTTSDDRGVQGGEIFRIWDLATTNPVKTSLVLRNSLRPENYEDITISPNNNWIVIHGKSGSVQLWNLAERDPAKEPIILHEDSVKQVAISSDSHWLVTGDAKGSVWLWDLTNPHPQTSPTILQEYHKNIVISPDSHWLTADGVDGSLRLWDLTTMSPKTSPIILHGQHGNIEQQEISPNSHWLATNDAGGSLQLWDLTALNPEATSIVLEHKSRIAELAFSGDNNWLVTRDPANVKLWNMKAIGTITKPLVLSEIPEEKECYYMTISPDSRWLITSDFRYAGASIVKLWDLMASNPLETSIAIDVEWDAGFYSSGRLEEIAISSNNEWLVAISDDGGIQSWDLRTRNPTKTSVVLRKPTESSSSFAIKMVISNDWRWLASVVSTTETTDGRAVWLLDLTAQSIEEALTILRHEAEVVRGLAISDNNQRLITASDDGSIRLLDLSADDPMTRTPIIIHDYSLPKNWGSIDDVAISSDSQRFLISGYAGGHGPRCYTELWKLTPPHLTQLAHIYHGSDTLAISPDIRWFVADYVGGKETTRRLWDLTNPDLTSPDPEETSVVLQGYNGEHRAATVSSNGRWLVIGSGDNLVQLWNMTSPNPEALNFVLPGDTQEIHSIAISSDGRRIVTGSVDNTARLWDLVGADTPRLAAVLQHGHEDAITNIKFSPDGLWLVGNIKFSPDDRWLVTVSTDYKTGQMIAQLWDITRPDLTKTSAILPGHEGLIRTVVFSPDGHWLFTGSDDMAGQLWDLTLSDPAKAPTVLHGHGGPINGAAFSSDSHWLATGSDDATIRLWDITSPNPAETAVELRGHEGSIQSVAISPDNRWILSGSHDGTARLWVLQIDELIERACRTAGRNLSLEEWRQYFRGEEYRKTCPEIPLHYTVFDDLIKQGERAAQQGKIKEALTTYTNVQQLHEHWEISPKSWNTLCRNGSLWGQADEVLDVCEKMVNLYPQYDVMLDNRGLARALTGNLEGAIEDFQAFVDSMESEEDKAQRQRWIEILQAGKNPFTPELLEQLRKE